MMKTREEMLAKADEFADGSETSVEGEVKALLLEIAGDDEDSMLDEAATDELLYVKDIYHFQAQAVRKVRKFLAE